MATTRNDSDNNIIVVAGPTASGKSVLALAVAELLNGEIINGDSMQIYREFRVLTARPGRQEEERVPHHLYGVLGVSESCSAGTWLKLALEVIADVRARGRRPIICGGTGLYLKILIEGIAPVPAVSQKVKDEVRKLYEREGGVAFFKRLAQFDPISASKLNPADGQRLVRAYEVMKATGRSLGDWHSEQLIGSPIDARYFTIILSPPRDALYQRINDRIDAMVRDGAIAEVAAVVKEKFDSNLPAMKALGVQDLTKYLVGECDLDEALENAKRATRHFAKRQLTWFRNKILTDLVIKDFGEREKTFVKVKPFLDALYQS